MNTPCATWSQPPVHEQKCPAFPDATYATGLGRPDGTKLVESVVIVGVASDGTRIKPESNSYPPCGAELLGGHATHLCLHRDSVRCVC